MIIIPQLWVDQKANGQMAERRGYGIYIEKNVFSAEVLAKRIDQVLNDPR